MGQGKDKNEKKKSYLHIYEAVVLDFRESNLKELRYNTEEARDLSSF